MSDLLELIRKTQPLYNHLSPAEAEVLSDLTAAVHNLQEQLEKVSAACVVVVQERDALQKQCEARAIAMRDHADKIETDQVHRLREQLAHTEADFEACNDISCRRWEEIQKLREQLVTARRDAIEECAGIAERNGWETTASMIRALTDEKGQP